VKIIFTISDKGKIISLNRGYFVRYSAWHSSCIRYFMGANFLRLLQGVSFCAILSYCALFLFIPYT
jgi:hypothetical protein